MASMEAFESQSEEILLPDGEKARKTAPQSKGNWLEHSFNDSDCLMGSSGIDCQVNSTLPALNNFTAGLNATGTTDFPPSLSFDENAMTDIIVYSVFFVVAAVGNLTVFITLFRNRHRKSRVNLMIMHLAAADLMVTLINFPLEVGWRITTQWVAGNLACKLFQFLRAFGLYLSSLVLVCISLDRYFAIVHPLKVNDAQRRGKMMLTFAWSIAAVCSLPQSVVFHVDAHPEYKNFIQCVTFGFFRSAVEERTYNIFCLTAMYFLPLFVIIVVYLRILWEISQKSKDSKEETTTGGRGGRGGRLRLRRSDMTNIERARSRTLRMTLVIVLAFFFCWTPYVIIVMWYMFDWDSAVQVNRRLQDVLFIMAVSNSCVNPLVYGTYTINFRNELNRCFGRKAKPQVLARKSTVMTSQDGRNSKLQVRSAVNHLVRDQIPVGSTAMRTTVTAQLSNSNTLKCSTHTQVMQREGSARTSCRRSPKGAMKDPSSQDVTRHSSIPALAPIISLSPGNKPCISSATTPTSRILSSSTSTSSTMASGCVMVEIEVDMDSQGTPNNPMVNLGSQTSKPLAGGSSTVPDSSLSFLNGKSESCSFEGITKTHDPTQAHLMLPEPSMPGKHSRSNIRKLSADSGVFFDNRQQRRKRLNSLTPNIGVFFETRPLADPHQCIELKTIRSLSNVL